MGKAEEAALTGQIRVLENVLKDRNYRETALAYAVRTLGHREAEVIVAAAETYQAFLADESLPERPEQAEQVDGCDDFDDGEKCEDPYDNYETLTPRPGDVVTTVRTEVIR